MRNSDNTRGQKGKVTGVGVGPGNPHHLTLLALDAIRSADIVIAPCTNPEIEGRAEGIVRQILPDLECRRIPFEMTSGESGIEARKRTAKEAAQNLIPLIHSGKNLAFITLGDPNIFSTFSTIANELLGLDDEIEIATVPGIMAFQEVASLSNIELLDEAEKLFLVTAFEGVNDVKESLEHQNAAIVIYKGGRHLGEIKNELKKVDRLDNAVVGELLGLSGQRVTSLANIEETEISYLATVISPPVRNPFDKVQANQTPTQKEKV